MYSITNVTSVPSVTERILRTLPYYAAERLSRRFRRSNLRSLGEYPHYIARCPAHSGGLSSNRLCGSTAAIGLIAVTAQINGHAVPALLKKASEKKDFPRASLIKMQYSFRISGNRGYVSNRVRFFP